MLFCDIIVVFLAIRLKRFESKMIKLLELLNMKLIEVSFAAHIYVEVLFLFLSISETGRISSEREQWFAVQNGRKLTLNEGTNTWNHHKKSWWWWRDPDKWFHHSHCTNFAGREPATGSWAQQSWRPFVC